MGVFPRYGPSSLELSMQYMQRSHRRKCPRILTWIFWKPLCRKHQDLEKQKWTCQKCRKQITRTVYDYSIGHFSKPLCIDCQQYHHRMAVKGDNTFEGKGFYCNKCKQTITFPTYSYSKRTYGTPLCKDCQEDQWQETQRKRICMWNLAGRRFESLLDH